MNPVSKAFRELEAEYYQAWFRFHPEVSVDVGVSEHAAKLRAYNDDDNGALIALNQKLVSALDEINTQAFDARTAIDYKLLRGAAETELHELEEQNWRYRDPQQYIPLHAIYQLLTHPVKNVRSAMVQRLQAIPEYLRGARAQILQAPEYIVPIWLESAVEQCVAGQGFLRDLGRHPLVNALFSNPAKLQPPCDAAAHALGDFARFLEAEVAARAGGDFACGSNHFNRLLANQHFFAADADQLLVSGERQLAQCKQALLEQTQHMQGDDNVSGLLGKIRNDQPAVDALMNTYRERMRASYEWLEVSDIISLPDVQSLRLHETPVFMQSMIPFAAYDPPSIIDTKQQGYYYVTVPAGSNMEVAMAEHNRSSIDLTCVHEAFPGHHLQFVLANQNNTASYTRLLNTSASMYEGWALYAEQLAVEQGLLNADAHRFMMLRDKLWRCLRIIVDVKLHTGKISLSQAVDFLVDELGFERAQAEAEISWYSSAPTLPSCYATGCDMILAARHQLVDKRDMGLKDFHDRLLQQGSIALPLVIEQSFGEAVWRLVHTAVFH